MGQISDFVEVFINDQDRYETLKEELDKLCKEKLNEQKIDFLWHSRVKEPESLRAKLEGRHSKYRSEAENIKDIKDLVGGRVIITRWKDFGLVEKVIKENFDVRETSQHPKSGQNLVTLQQRFRGYDGLHFYVTRQVADCESYRHVVMEIQVMSGYMWAFSTVEHDITYKKKRGEPHDNLLSLLDMMKGIANAGEVALEMLDSIHIDLTSPCFQQNNAGLILGEEICTFARGKKDLVAARSQNLKRKEAIVSWASKADVENDHNTQRIALGWQYKDSGQWFRPFYDTWLVSFDKPNFGLLALVSKFHSFRSKRYFNLQRLTVRCVAGTGKSSLV